MRYVFLLGGIAGFTLAAIAGWIAGRAADRILLDSAIGCLAGALLFRWLWNVLLHGLRETFLARQATTTALAKKKTITPEPIKS